LRGAPETLSNRNYLATSAERYGRGAAEKGKFELATAEHFPGRNWDMNPVTQQKYCAYWKTAPSSRLGGTQTIPVGRACDQRDAQEIWGPDSGGEISRGFVLPASCGDLELPPLRAHKEDIALLARPFCTCTEHGWTNGRD